MIQQTYVLFESYILNLHCFLIYSCLVWACLQLLTDPWHLLPDTASLNHAPSTETQFK